ncbi:OTU domain-containing protein 6B [Hypsizygus marmoreus]|uniref:OTU domain-containing protein 6B n=1 Tax=Hypsizygus marmoreus TaxID=39966 RepID=A0A369JKV5_HYPMA|nr:OTU domain-containing protein 6B [Hypsizygus marmoreus]
MAGSKRNKLKKALAPSRVTPEPPVDDDLMDDLFAQLDSRDQTVQSESAAVINSVQRNQQERMIETHNKQDAKSRFKARQVRKAAALEQTYSAGDPEAEARMEKEAKDEERDIYRVCQELSLQLHEINPDGHCLFSAIADQLALLGILPPSQASYSATRQAASHYIFSHPDDFLPFLPPLAGEESGTVSHAGLMTPDGFERYCATIRDTAEWGGEPEILALSRAYNVPIHVVQGGSPSIVIHDPRQPPIDTADEKRVVRISYHRRMYGLGEHYNSLRPKGPLSQLSQKMHDMLAT